jgi:hypothetical protein
MKIKIACSTYIIILFPFYLYSKDINAQLISAIKQKNYDTVRTLLDRGADPNIKYEVLLVSPFGGTLPEGSWHSPLLTAIITVDKPLFDLLIQNSKTNVNEYCGMDSLFRLTYQGLAPYTYRTSALCRLPPAQRIHIQKLMAKRREMATHLIVRGIDLQSIARRTPGGTFLYWKSATEEQYAFFYEAAYQADEKLGKSNVHEATINRIKKRQENYDSLQKALSEVVLGLGPIKVPDDPLV